MRKTDDHVSGFSAPLRRTITLTRVGIVVERGARAFWPFLTLTGGVFAAHAFQVPALLPDTVGRWTLYGSAGILALAFGYGAWRFRWPSTDEAVARLDATLPGRPISALTDRIAAGTDDPAVAALWLRHINRMRERAERARPVPPEPDLAKRDPFALRLTALTAVAVAAMFGAPFAPVFIPPTGTPAVAAPGQSWEGWAQPPRYTGKPGLYLNALDGDGLSVPEGTRFTFRFYGRAPEFSQTVAPQMAAPPDPMVQEFVAQQSGLITVDGRRFVVTVLADANPTVTLNGAAERRADGRFVQPFTASDDFGIVSGTAQVRLDLAKVPRRYGLAIAPEARPDLVFDLPLPVSGSRAKFAERLNEDAAKSVWANLPVTLSLTVEDALGQQGTAGPVDMVLPGKRFFDPRAAALAEARRDILWNRANAPQTAQILRAITNRPDDVFADAQTGAAVRAVALRLEDSDLNDHARDDVAEILWQLATLLEDGGQADALAAMQQAQQRLSEAMRNGASADEIRKLMQDLKEATDRYLNALAQQSQQEPQFDRNSSSQTVTSDQIQKMMDAIQELMQQGKMAEAQELLDQLARMMQNMQVTQGQGQGEGDQSAQGQSMRDLENTLKNQKDLSDDAFGSLQGDQPQSADDLAQRQRQLSEDLQAQRHLMPQSDDPAGAEAQRRLDEAGRAMDRAGQALERGDTGSALDEQADAIRALRDGMRSLRDSMSGAREDGAESRQRMGDRAGGDGQNRDGRDPLGRSTGEGSQGGTDRNMLQNNDVYGRAQALLDEIRRRSAERQRPQDELDYLERLLDRF